MKKWFLLFLLAAAAGAQAQQFGVDNPELKLPSGRVLLHTRVINFDGAAFEIENANGRTQIPWASMPREWQLKFPADAARAANVAAIRKQVALAHNPEIPAVTVVAAQSKSPNEMELPRYNLDTTLEDLKPGITAEKAKRILGSPLRVNGTQWVYANGYVYVENGIVTALQNRAGGVFASSYK